HYAHRAALFERKIVRRKCCITHGFAGSGQREWYCSRNVLAIFRIELGFPVEVANFSGDFYRRFRNIVGLDSADAAFPLGQRRPKSFAAMPRGVTQPIPVITTRRGCLNLLSMGVVPTLSRITGRVCAFRIPWLLTTNIQKHEG